MFYSFQHTILYIFIRFLLEYFFCERRDGERKKEGEREDEKMGVREKGEAIINGIIFFILTII